VAPYTISYLGAAGELLERREQCFRNDDHALDTVGQSKHPHQILVHHQGRLVARFPPWPRESR
jgi:hypothetical protein